MAKTAIIADNDDTDPPEAGAAENELHDRLLRQFDEIALAEAEERAAALEDRRFVTIAGAQWEGDWGEQFANSVKVEIDKTSQGVERIMDQYRANRVLVNFREVDKGASAETAETLNGIFRADFYRSHGQQVFDNAFEEAVQGGYGALRLTNEYCDEYDPDDERQHICFKAIPDADQSVYFVGGKLYDKSDATGCYVISALSEAEFAKQYPDASPDGFPEGFLKPQYDWFLPATIRVAEYYEVEEAGTTLYVFQHRATDEERREYDLKQEDRAKLDLEGWRLMRTRRVKRRRIHKWEMSGTEILADKGYIAGDQIPVVPVYGKRRIVDGVERVRGHVRKAKDPQRVYNSQISKLTETAALAPLERPIVTAGQIAGLSDHWANMNLDRAPYAVINDLTDNDGKPIYAGPVGKIEPPQLPPVLGALIQVTNGDIKELTTSDDAAAQVKSNVSAEAMDIAATRIDDKAFTYLDNMRQSVQRVGEVWLSMTRDVLVEEGRQVETMDAEGKVPGVAVLSERYTDEATGAHSIRNDIQAGKYNVISDVTEATTTRRDKTVRTLVNGAQIVSAYDPELASAMMGTAILNMDGEGIDELQDWQRTRMVQSGVVKPTEEEQRQMDEAAQNQQPDPQAAALEAVAKKETALAGKALADTELSKAKTEETLAKAHATRVGAHEQQRSGVFGRLSSLFGGGKAKPQGDNSK